MCIEYNECHYGGMYNVYVKRIFVITEIVHMNEKTGTGVNSEKEKVKESQSRSVKPSLDTPSGVGLGASHIYIEYGMKQAFPSIIIRLRRVVALNK